jgi:hypothetical protein
MMRVSEPGDIGRVLRFAGRLGHQASLSAARLRDLADVVRALAISLVLDAHGGWISVRELGDGCGPGLEVVAFDRCTCSEAEQASEPWPHLESQLHALGALGAAVSVEPTPGGGTAVWTRIAELPAGPRAGDLAMNGRTTGGTSGGTSGGSGTATLDVTGLLQAPPGEVYAGWTAARHGDRLGILICETPPDGSLRAVAHELLRTPPGPTPETLFEAQRQLLSRFLRPLGELAAALIEVDLAARTVRTVGSGGIALRVVLDGKTADGPDLRWDRSLSVLAHTAGIRPSPEEFAATAPAALRCATLMREYREPTPTACVAAALVETPAAT